MAVMLDTDTFKGGSATVSFVGRVAEERLPSLDTGASEALIAAKKDFAEAKAGIEGGSASEHFAALRASIGERKEISESLGAQAFGGDSKQIEVGDMGQSALIAKMVTAASAKFGEAPERTASIDGPEPQNNLPGKAKGPRVLS